MNFIFVQSKSDNGNLMMMPMMTVETEEGGADPDSEGIRRIRRSMDSQPSAMIQVTLLTESRD